MLLDYRLYPIRGSSFTSNQWAHESPWLSRLSGVVQVSPDGVCFNGSAKQSFTTSQEDSVHCHEEISLILELGWEAWVLYTHAFAKFEKPPHSISTFPSFFGTLSGSIVDALNTSS